MKKQLKYVGREKEYRREYYQNHKEHLDTLRRQSRERNATYYREYHKLYRWKHPEYRTRQIEIGKKWREALKLEILTHYGNGKCACVKCGESRMACLSIDHINGEGYRHRKELRGKDIGGMNFYRWLRKNNYPAGYQTLCMNCQWVKRIENNELPKGRQTAE